jgi:hypothetical protein
MYETEFATAGFPVSLRFGTSRARSQVADGAFNARVQASWFMHQVIQDVIEHVMDAFGHDARGHRHPCDALRCMGAVLIMPSTIPSQPTQKQWVTKELAHGHVEPFKGG